MCNLKLIKEYTMGPKMLTGSMLVGGPLLGIIMVFLEPAVGEDVSFVVADQQVLENSTQAIISILGFAVALLAITIGTAYLARSMQGEQKPGFDLRGIGISLSPLVSESSCCLIRP